MKQNSTTSEIVELNTKILDKITANYLKIPVDYTIHILDQLVLVEEKNTEANKENNDDISQDANNIQEDEKVKIVLDNLTKIHDALGTLSAKQKRKFKNLLAKYTI